MHEAAHSQSGLRMESNTDATKLFRIPDAIVTAATDESYDQVAWKGDKLRLLLLCNMMASHRSKSRERAAARKTPKNNGYLRAFPYRAWKMAPAINLTNPDPRSCCMCVRGQKRLFLEVGVYKARSSLRSGVMLCTVNTGRSYMCHKGHHIS